MFLIYVVSHIPSGKRYIGITMRTIEARWKSHIYSVAHGSQSYLHRAIRLYGEDQFTIRKLRSVGTKAKACSAERYFIQCYKTAAPRGYNMTEGGEGSWGRIFSQTSIKRMRLAQKGRPCSDSQRATLAAGRETQRDRGRTERQMSAALANIRLATKANVGRRLSRAHTLAMSAARKGKPCSEKQLRALLKMAASRKGKPASKRQRAALNHLNKSRIGVALTAAHRDAIRQGLIGKTFTPERRENISRALKQFNARKRRQSRSGG